MPKMPQRSLLAAVALLISCASVTPEVTRTLPGSVPELGMALTPARFPRHGEAEVDRMFELGRQVGRYAVFIYQWSQPDLLTLAESALARSRKLGLTPMLAISPTTLSGLRSEYDPPSRVRERAGPKLSFADERIHKPYIETVAALARLKPPYLCLATEINMMAFADIEEYLAFAHVYKRLYPVIKQISPETRVFVSFQWDFLRVLDRKEPGKIAEHSKLIDVFRPELDLIAFTSYPSTQVDNPAALPGDYYSALKAHVKGSDEVIFMEIGWPTGGKGSPREQAQFIEALPRLMAELRPTILAWSLLHDVTGVFQADLATTGLLSTAGEPKPGLAAFKALRQRWTGDR